MAVIKPALHHVTFKTTRLDEMMAWYGTVLGGTINFKDDHNGWMTNDEANHRFAFLSVPGLEDDPDKVKHNVMHHCAFEYESFSDLMSSYARMRDEGIVPAFSLDHGITMSFYYAWWPMWSKSRCGCENLSPRCRRQRRPTHSQSSACARSRGHRDGARRGQAPELAKPARDSRHCG